jgi:hypothetical protein
MPQQLGPNEEAKLGRLARALVDQHAARVIVPPQAATEGYWFGGGNMIEDADGRLYLVGRYRNQGDSRTGVQAGERGLELAIFCSLDRGATFEKIVRFTKADLTVGDRDVLSIEGSALRPTERGVELFVSTEKNGEGYPDELADFLKPGTGVWSIDHLAADTVEGLACAAVHTVLESNDPEVVQHKDPAIYDASSGDLVLFFCTHPFGWSSSNSALAVRTSGAIVFSPADYTFFPRGFTWDVAITRTTAVVDVPPVGPFAAGKVSLVFYDGGESLRQLDEHAAAVTRPRGYSCEELGGVAYVCDEDWRGIARLSKNRPWLVSPYGTGCSRYVDVHVSHDGYFVTWQQAQADGSQPLVMNFLGHDDARRILE